MDGQATLEYIAGLESDIRVHLVTRDQRHLAYVHIPSLNAMPEIIVWDDRFFVPLPPVNIAPGAKPLPVYRQAFGLVAVLTEKEKEVPRGTTLMS